MSTHSRHASVDQPRPVPFANRVAIRLLGSPLRRLLGGKLAVLRYRAQSGAVVTLPVQVACDAGEVVAMAGAAAGKRWWRHFLAPARVEVLLDGGWHIGTGTVAAGADRRPADAYAKVFPHLAISSDAAFVVVVLREDTVPVSAPLRGRHLWWTWWWRVTAAEFAGFTVPACVGALTAQARPGIAVPALLGAGAVEGAVLGWGQAGVLRRAVAGVSTPRWIVATSGAAVLAYAIGLLPSTFHESIASWPMAVIVLVAAVLGVALLASIGTAQWLVLRRRLPHAGRWIASTALAWMVGLIVFLGFAMPLWRAGQPIALILLIGIVGGVLMAATVSAITGAALLRLLR